MIDHFKYQFRYDNWANNRVLDALESWDQPSERATGLMAHIIAAQMVWFNRVEPQGETAIKIWPALSLYESRSLSEKQYQRWRDYLDKLDESVLLENISYTNSKGKSFQNVLKDILQHVIIHGQHHRAQIAFLLREAGKTPPPTDFIFFIRTGL